MQLYTHHETGTGQQYSQAIPKLLQQL